MGRYFITGCKEKRKKKHNNEILALSPGDSMILSRSHGENLLRDKIWEWPEDEANEILHNGHCWQLAYTQSGISSGQTGGVSSSTQMR